VRKIKRIRNAAHQLCYVLDLPAEGWEIDPTTGNRKFGGKKTHPRAEAIAWIKECLELKDDQFVLVSSLPDDPPAKSARAAGPKVKRVLKPGQSWLLRSGGQVFTDHYGVSNKGLGEWPGNLQRAAQMAKIDLNWDEVFWVTEAQFDRLSKKGDLPQDRNLSYVVKAKLEAVAKKAPLDEAQTLQAIRRAVGEYNRALPIVMAQFFPNLTITADQATDVINLAGMAKIDLRNRPIVAKIDSEINALIETYPLLFQKSEPDHYQNYITAIQASQGKR
jgi:hypothetical protein